MTDLASAPMTRWETEARLSLLAMRKRNHDLKARRPRRGWHWASEFDPANAALRVGILYGASRREYEIEAQRAAEKKRAELVALLRGSLSPSEGEP